MDSKSQRKFWSFLRSKTSCNPKTPASIINNQTAVNDVEKAEQSNDYFSSLFSEEYGKPPPFFHCCSERLEDIHFTVIEVYEQLKNKVEKFLVARITYFT